ncbi:MAG: UvrD-helicase domain-containing protein [Elainellaceae cyanobacterium]
MGLTKQQAHAAHAPHSIAVTAGAGTGKTHMLSARYLYFLNQGVSPLAMVAVTFTDKAATELRSRIRQTVAQSDLADKDDLLAELEAAQISTFHALAARICREHPDQAGVPPDFTVQDNLESPLWLAETKGEALAQLPEHLYAAIPYSQMQAILNALLSDPLTAAAALQRDRPDWLPELTEFRQSYLENIATHPTWVAAREQLLEHIGPAGDKREQVRQQAIELISAFQASFDPSYLAQVLDLNLTGGSKKKWDDPASFDAVRDAINSLKDKSKGHLPKVLAVLDNLVPNEYDDQTEAMLPAIREAFDWVREFLRQAKYRQQLLDFGDLEVHALQALQHPEVQAYYAQRWRVFLIDEFQDTNPAQGELVEHLTAKVILTIVGDAKQSIYGFRRADVQVFRTWQDRIHPPPAQPVALSQSFRTHKILMDQINQVFEPILGDLHQPLAAQRQDGLEPSPMLQLHTVVVDDACKQDKTLDTNIDACRRVEAQAIADLIQTMLAEKHQVFDKSQQTHRAIQPGDLAILARHWAPLELYGAAIAARGIPIVQAAGGNLLDTREAKDAEAMLRFLADPTDSLALAAVLRSPFFAVSDVDLYDLAQALPNNTEWWTFLRTGAMPTFNPAVESLQALLVARRTEPPSRLLQLGDRLTGYTAVIANLPGGDRRLTDWTGFVNRVRDLEAGSFDVLAVVRRLQRIRAGEGKIERPTLAAGNAVSLMTIYGAKGLEWPVVIVPDLTHALMRTQPTLRFDAALGVALKLTDEDGHPQKSALYTLLEQQTWADQTEEDKRVLYVALTRARDHLILTAAGDRGHSLDLLQAGLDRVVTPTPIPFDRDRVLPVAHPSPLPPSVPNQVMMLPARSGISELPVTALSEYALCPKRFEFHHVQGHPGYREGDGSGAAARAIGKLAHKALEYGIRDFDRLKKYATDLTDEQVQDALDCAERFHHAPDFAAYRERALQWELPVSLSVRGITFNGVADLVGEDFVLDFKTDRTIHPEHHQFQLWAYSHATTKPTAHIAYLRHDRLYTFPADHLSRLEASASVLVNGLVKGNFTPSPSEASCGICPYAELCEGFNTGAR